MLWHDLKCRCMSIISVWTRGIWNDYAEVILSVIVYKRK